MVNLYDLEERAKRRPEELREEARRHSPKRRMSRGRDGLAGRPLRAGLGLLLIRLGTRLAGDLAMAGVATTRLS